MVSDKCSKTGKFLPTESRFNSVDGDINNCGIYKITNSTNGKIYVGSTITSFKKRWQKHIHRLSKNSHVNPHLQNSFNKHGINSFIFDILEACNPVKEFIIDRENYYINTLVTLGFDYNVMPAREQGQKCTFSQSECLDIIDLYLSSINISQKDLSVKYKTSLTTIKKIIHGKYYNSINISKSLLQKCKDKGKASSGHLSNLKQRKLTKESAGKIKWLLTKSNESQKIADYFNINTGTLYSIKIGKTYKYSKIIECPELLEEIGLLDNIKKEIVLGKIKWLCIQKFKSNSKIANYFNVHVSVPSNIKNALKKGLKYYINIEPIPCPNILKELT